MHGPANGPFYAIYYPVLAAVGVPANSVAIVILSRGRCGLSLCISYYLLAIAVTDFLVIITAVILNRIGGIYFRYSVLSTTPGCTVSSVLVYATRDGSVWLTVAFTIDRFVAICCQRLKTRYCNEKTALQIIVVVCALSFLKNVPFFFTYQPLYIIENVPWFCDIIASFYISPFWQTYLWLDRILTPFLPFFFIMLLNALTVRHILVASRARKRLRGDQKHGDPEMVNRKKSIVLLFAISFSFLLLWVTYVGHFFYVQITGEAYFTGLDFNDPQYIFQETTNMLQLLSSCTNIFIYAVTQTKFREELKYLVMYPFITIIGCFHR
ncbi:probable G-protein coupled receptor 139 isoform X1 [Stegostoma tigrinum]|uniref:probable G-protein coupled receptor 139 isoform X1 n=1 Tax=Stegostoma tigrinum TaxID=3053191 RepID=UPI00202B03AA|nr:probable G-protein coupled receptor 139 isoform X1 [Stegostoma tigrinum]